MILPTAVAGSVSFRGYSSVEDFSSDPALLAALITDLANAAGVSKDRVVVTGTTLLPDSNPPTLDVAYIVTFAGGAAAEAGAVGLADPPLTTFVEYTTQQGDVSVSGSTISASTDVEGSISLLGWSSAEDFDSSSELASALAADIGNAAGVSEDRVAITEVTLVSESDPSSLDVVFTVSFPRSDAVVVALADPALATFVEHAEENHTGIKVVGVELSGTTSVTGSVSIEGWSSADPFNNDATLAESLKANLATTAGVSEDFVTITGATLAPDVSPPTVKVAFALSIPDLDVGTAALADPTLANLVSHVEENDPNLEVSVDGVAIFGNPTVEGSVSLQGYSSTDDVSSDPALLAFMIADLARAAGVVDEMVTITGTKFVPDSEPPTVDVSFTVAFTSGAAVETGAASLADPPLTSFVEYAEQNSVQPQITIVGTALSGSVVQVQR